MSEKPRLVIDSQVLLRAIINRKSLPGRLLFDLFDRYILLTSEETLAEIVDVLNRPKIRRKFGFDDETVIFQPR